MGLLPTEHELIQFFSQKKLLWIRLFQIFEFSVVVLVFFFAWQSFAVSQPNETILALRYELAGKLGELAVLLFSVTLAPGILSRLRITFPYSLFVRTSLMLVRRHLGISMFVTALAHALLIRVFDEIIFGVNIYRIPFYEVLGISALTLLTPLYLTSNDWAQRTLRHHWKQLHRLVYIIAWFIFGHVALGARSLWSIVILTVAIMEIWSWIVYWWEQRRLHSERLDQPNITDVGK